MASESTRGPVSIARISAKLENLMLPMGLLVDQVDFSAASVNIDTGSLQIESEVPGSMVATISSTSLEKFLESQSPAGLRDFRVELADGILTVHAVKNVFVDLPATALCRLKIVDSRQLFVVLESVEVLGAGVKNLVQSQLDHINPVLDVKDLPLPVELTSVEVSGGQISLHGNVRPPKLPL